MIEHDKFALVLRNYSVERRLSLSFDSKTDYLLLNCVGFVF